MKNNFVCRSLLCTLLLCSCFRPQQSISTSEDSGGLTWGLRDSTVFYDESRDVEIGRKIIYRDVSKIKPKYYQNGLVAFKICINKAGLVTYVENIPSETTINDKEVLKMYFHAAKTYKFEPSNGAPKEQCGNLKFRIESSKGIIR